MSTLASIPSLLRMSQALGLIACMSLANAASAQSKTTLATTDQEQTKPLPGSHGWANFTTVDRDELKLSDQQFTELRDMDTKFTPDYNALGLEPWRNEKFAALNQKRDKAIRGIMTPEQYKQWSAPSVPVQAAPPSIIPAEQ